jgi:hypothetical protein
MVVSYSIAGYPECHLEDFAKMRNSLNKSYCTLINLFHQQLHYASISKKKLHDASRELLFLPLYK